MNWKLSRDVQRKTVQTMLRRSVFLGFLGAGIALAACGSQSFLTATNDAPDGSTGDGSVGDDDSGGTSHDSGPSDSGPADAGASDGSISDASTGPVAIVTGQNNPHDLIVVGDTIYWTNYAEIGMSSLQKARADGTTSPSKMADATHANRLASDGTSIFFTDFVSTSQITSIVARVTIANNAFVALQSSAFAPMGIAVSGDNVYVAQGFGSNGGGYITVDSMDGGGGVLASNLLNPVSIAVDSDGVAWTENGSSALPTNGKAVFVQLDGGPTGFQSSLASAWGITLTPTTAYFTSLGLAAGSNGSVDQSPRNSTGSGPVAFANTTTRPYFLTNDGTTIFWSEEGLGALDGSIRYARITDLVPHVLASAQERPHGIAVDASYVYWTSYSTGKIYRTRKP